MLKVIRHRQYWQCIRELFSSTFEDKKILFHLLFALMVLIIGIISNLSVPLLLKMIVESFSTPTALPFTLILVSYGVIWMVSQASTDVRAFLTYKIEQRITYTLGVRILSHLYGLSQRYFIDQKPGAITNIIRRAQRDIPFLILGIFFQILPTLLEFLCVVILIANFYPPEFSFLIGGTLIVFFLYTFASMKSVLRERNIANDVDQKVDGIVTDWLSNHEAIKTFGQKNFAIRTCEHELKKRENAEVSFMAKLSFARLGQSLILSVGLSLLTYLVGTAIIKHELTMGDFVLFNGYILQFILPISILGQVAQDVKKALLDMKGVMEVLLTESDIKESPHVCQLLGDGFQVEFKNVSFCYKDKNILEDLSFKVEPGETALVIGPTGIGKSTLAKLLLRLYDPTKGQILLNQTSIKELSFQSLYETIGWVPQETYLLNDTIKNNILFVQPDASLRDVEEALDQASLLDFVMSLPEKLDSLVGDKGLRLSGGQKQRLSLARIFLKKPKICIFDEPTSFLDRGTELIIQNNISTYLPNITKIIITHRPFVVEGKNKIIDLNRSVLIKKKHKPDVRKKDIYFSQKLEEFNEIN